MHQQNQQYKSPVPSTGVDRTLLCFNVLFRRYYRFGLSFNAWSSNSGCDAGHTQGGKWKRWFLVLVLVPALALDLWILGGKIEGLESLRRQSLYLSEALA